MSFAALERDFQSDDGPEQYTAQLVTGLTLRTWLEARKVSVTDSHASLLKHGVIILITGEPERLTDADVFEVPGKRRGSRRTLRTKRRSEPGKKNGDLTPVTPARKFSDGDVKRRSAGPKGHNNPLESLFPGYTDEQAAIMLAQFPTLINLALRELSEEDRKDLLRGYRRSPTPTKRNVGTLSLSRITSEDRPTQMAVLYDFFLHKSRRAEGSKILLLNTEYIGTYALSSIQSLVVF